MRLREACERRLAGHHLLVECEIFPVHCLDVSVKYGWELVPDIESRNRVAGLISDGDARSSDM